MLKFSIIGLVLAAALAASTAHASEPMTAEALASRAGDGHFEFRGSARTLNGFENVIWRFSPDGRVSMEGALSKLFYLGGMGEQFGLKGTGTWHRAGDKICIAWDDYNRRFDGCYGLLVERGLNVHLTGPLFFSGTLERAAEAPARVAARPASARSR